jgi:hypothetical protein
MLRVGRNRTKNKRMPKGWTPIGNAVYFVPTNAADLEIVMRETGGKKSLRLGALADHNECAATYAAKVVKAREARDVAQPGTVGELVYLARRDILPTIQSEVTKAERKRHWSALEGKFGAKPYARNVYEASRDRSYFTALDVQAHLDGCSETRPVAANREVDSWALIFDWARNRWGRTEYNPCRGVEKNPEEPRDTLPDHVAVYKGSATSEDGEITRGIYRQLDPPARFVVNMYRYYGRRQGESLRLTLGDAQHEDGLHMLRGKERQRKPTKKKAPRKPRVLIIPWDDAVVKGKRRPGRLRKMLARVLRWRAKKIREALPTTMLLVGRLGTPYSKSAIKSAWRRGMERAKQKGQFTMHDLRALRADTLPEDVAVNVLAHDDASMVRKVYGNRGPHVVNLKGHK